MRVANLISKTPEELKEIENTVSKEIIKISDAAVKKANKILNKYGMAALMQIVIQEADQIDQLKSLKSK